MSDAETFYHYVYATVCKIPYGKVTSYGHIANLMEMPNHARQVGSALKNLPDGALRPDAEYHSLNVPWWRVINSQGKISLREYGRTRQQDKLLEEGVETVNFTVQLSTYGWFPDEIEVE